MKKNSETYTPDMLDTAAMIVVVNADGETKFASRKTVPAMVSMLRFIADQLEKGAATLSDVENSDEVADEVAAFLKTQTDPKN